LPARACPNAVVATHSNFVGGFEAMTFRAWLARCSLKLMDSEIRYKTTSYTPVDLALWLDLWAFRREKILELLDIRAAQRARRLGSKCRNLSYRDRGDRTWVTDWYALRVEVAAFLTDHHASVHGRDTPRTPQRPSVSWSLANAR
jgi:hypothetical protein